MLRAMVSLDPLTITQRSYPLLFQSGETAFGRPLTDAQHPHDALMELSVQYVRPVGERSLFTAYYAPVGDAALGPVAFPHRASAMELPQAALGHHWQDATHIASNVATVGFNYGGLRIEASGFSGREPDENRWNIDWGDMDSWSTRVSFQPRPNWLLQTSVGRLKEPEPLHAGDVTRLTASLQYTQPRAGSAAWSSTLLFGRNQPAGHHGATNSVLAETVYPLTPRNLLTGRFEWGQRDELFGEDGGPPGAFGVFAFTGGYTRELPVLAALRSAAGFNFTAYRIAEGLKPFYGAHPVAASVFLRFRLWSTR
jgi:hypothetical protein